MRPIEVMLAAHRLWQKVPVGSGMDHNTLIKYIEETDLKAVKK